MHCQCHLHHLYIFIVANSPSFSHTYYAYTYNAYTYNTALRPQCSPPPSLPPTLSVFVTPESPTITTASDTDINLTCNVQTTPQGPADAYDFTYHWELDGTVCSNGSSSVYYRFSMSVQTQGVYRCVVSLRNSGDYPIVEVSTGVTVKLPRKRLGCDGGGGVPGGRGEP